MKREEMLKECACLKDQIEDMYCNQLLSQEKIAAKLNMSVKRIPILIEHFHLTRDASLVQSKALRDSEEKQRNYSGVKSRVTKDAIVKWYIEEDHDYNDAAEHFGIARSMFDKLCKDYGIRKDKSKSRYKGLETCKKKYGEDNIVNQRKCRETIIGKYGSMENYYRQRKEKAEATNLERYGFRYKATADLITNHSEQYLKCWHDAEYSKQYLMSHPKKPTVEELANELNCSVNSVHLWIEKYDLGAYTTITKSSYEQDIIEFVEGLGLSVDRNNRTVLGGQELDVYIPRKKVAIEFNGNYFHDIEKVGKKYHFEKSYKCEQMGIRLIHVYQYQWDDPIKRDILKSIITNAVGKNGNIVYARKCELRELTKKDVERFSVENSLHGHRNASVYLGLFHDGELLEVMSFGKAFFSRDGSIDYECIRSITKKYTTVVGGMNKLFSYFIKKYKPKKILYYVDYNTHTGNSMGKLGFKFISYSKYGMVNIANCKEVMEKFGFVFNRKPELNKTIEEYRKQGKVLVIYDAGVKKYIWERDPATSD